MTEPASPLQDTLDRINAGLRRRELSQFEAVVVSDNAGRMWIDLAIAVDHEGMSEQDIRVARSVVYQQCLLTFHPPTLLPWHAATNQKDV